MESTNQIGIVGGGQLGMMLTEASIPLGDKVTVLEKAGCPASFAGAKVLTGSITDPKKILALGKQSDIVTVEIEHIDVEALRKLAAEGISVHPSPETLAMIKDKYAQKVFLQRAGIPTAAFQPIDTEEDFARAGTQFGYPYVLKTRHGAYDGRGNERVMDEQDIPRAKSGLSNKALYAEAFIEFDKELAIIAARSTTGEICTYPVVETIHEKDILRYTLAPADIPQDIAKKAQQLAYSALENLRGAGVFGVEMFLTTQGNVLVNEIAPRVHNSGHYTIEACKTSQFTQHLLAITGRPLGETRMTSPAAVMVNILGDSAAPAKTLHGQKDAEALGDVYVHYYHKKPKNPPDPVRKNGHITVLGNSLNEARSIADQARNIIHYE